jgi:choline-sulfatase
MYNPDAMPAPNRGRLDIDHMDEQIPWMNHAVWAEDINDALTQNLISRYYGEISYVDACIGRLLDAVESRPDADNTLICFFSDHGDHLGDHHAWQKESYFEASCRVPFLLSWPGVLAPDTRSDALVCLTDLFAIAAGAAGIHRTRDGIDVLGLLSNKNSGRDHLIGYYGRPGTELFKVMVRWNQWKYIFMANGNREQLFNLTDDPNELRPINPLHSDIADLLRIKAVEAMAGTPWASLALENGTLRGMPYRPLPKLRINQFDLSRGIKDFSSAAVPRRGKTE